MDYMMQAVEAAKKEFATGGGPFGAVIVKEGQVIAAAGNTVVSEWDPTAHAELRAIRLASQKLKSFDLSDCELYTTCEPCPMCLGAILWANVSKVYYHSTHAEATKYGFSADRLINYFKGEANDTLKIKAIREHQGASDLWQDYATLHP